MAAPVEVKRKRGRPKRVPLSSDPLPSQKRKPRLKRNGKRKVTKSKQHCEVEEPSVFFPAPSPEPCSPSPPTPQQLPSPSQQIQPLSSPQAPSSLPPPAPTPPPSPLPSSPPLLEESNEVSTDGNKEDESEENSEDEVKVKKKVKKKSTIFDEVKLEYTVLNTEESPERPKRIRRRDKKSRELAAMSKPESYDCTVCGRKFKEKSHLATHARAHIDIRNFKCNECGGLFKTKANLFFHMKTHSDAPFTCEKCSKTYPERKILKRHIRVVHG